MIGLLQRFDRISLSRLTAAAAQYFQSIRAQGQALLHKRCSLVIPFCWKTVHKSNYKLQLVSPQFLITNSNPAHHSLNQKIFLHSQQYCWRRRGCGGFVVRLVLGCYLRLRQKNFELKL